jgi:hypothetical protein
MKHQWKVLFISLENMVAMDNSCFSLAEIFQIFSTETGRHNDLFRDEISNFMEDLT